MSRDDANRSNCDLHSDPGQVPPSVVGSLARSSIGLWRLAPIGEDYRWQPDRRRSTSSAPQLWRAIQPTARPLCLPRGPREIHGRAAPGLPRSVIPASLCCPLASEPFSTLAPAGQPLWPRLDAASRNAGHWEGVPSASVSICVAGVASSIRPCSIAPLRRKAVCGLLILLERPSRLRSQHPPQQSGPPNSTSGLARSYLNPVLTSFETSHLATCRPPRTTAHLRSISRANSAAIAAPP